MLLEALLVLQAIGAVIAVATHDKPSQPMGKGGLLIYLVCAALYSWALIALAGGA